MASMQCYKPTDQTEVQAQYQSKSQLPAHTVSTTQIKCYSQTQTHEVDQGLPKAQSTQFITQTHASRTNGHHGTHRATNGMACQPCQGNTKKRGEHKKKERRNLLQKIKDGLSGHSSDSSSSSESDSDNDNCEKRKASDIIIYDHSKFIYYVVNITHIIFIDTFVYMIIVVKLTYLKQSDHFNYLNIYSNT